jgi:UDPglucose 6-dehydrogenase
MVIGAGYVGLSMAAVLSKVHQVTVVELKKRLVDAINKGIAPIREQGLEELMSSALESHRLVAVTPSTKFSQQDVLIVCVDTPCAEDGSASLIQLSSVMDTVESNLDDLIDEYLVLALRSTVPPMTTRKILLERVSNREGNVGVVFSPEFLRQGHAIHDLTKPDRVVIGGNEDRAIKRYREMLLPCLAQVEPQIYTMSLESAELCKYVSNSFLACKVSFVNEVASLAERIPGVSIDDVMNGVIADSRICPSHLRPGLGFGGSCFPKDLFALIGFAGAQSVDMKILKSVMQVNSESSKRLVELLNAVVPSLQGKKIAVLGLTFKAGTDDTRNSPSLELIDHLCLEGSTVWAHDPAAKLESIETSLRARFRFSEDIDECIGDADAVVLMTDWPIYTELGLKKLTETTKGRVFIDGRRAFVDSNIPKGVIYRALGSCFDNMCQ